MANVKFQSIHILELRPGEDSFDQSRDNILITWMDDQKKQNLI